jgi:hypothetical protein
MTPQEIQKLLGGYATGALTEAEQQALFEAALHDQALFDALAREQSLRDLLRDPAARAQLLSALEPAPPRRFWTWRPIAAVPAMAVIATLAGVIARKPRPVLVGQAPRFVSPLRIPPANSVVSQPVVVPERAPAAPVVKPRRKPAPPAVLPTTPPPEPVSDAVVEAPKVQVAIDGTPKPEAADKAEERVQVTAAAPILPPVVTSRTNLLAPDSQAVPAPQFRMQVQASGARQLFYGAAPRPLAVASGANTFARQPSSLALRYTILRRDASGALAEVDRADLTPSDTVALRFTANTTGYLTVGDATPVSLTDMKPYTTPPLPSIPVELKIIFAPQPQRQAPSAAAITEVQYRDTYVANRVPGQPLTFTIKLP